MRFTKIMPTLGPSSWDTSTIEALALAGAAAFRLNFSHGDLPRHQQTYASIRQVAEKLNRPIAILQDLQGPKIRIGSMEGKVEMVVGQPFMLDSNPATGDVTRVHLPHPEILAALQVGDVVSLNDGVIRLRVTSRTATAVSTVVEAGGSLSSRKGVNVPGRTLPMSALTEKDRVDLQAGLAMGVDWVALSFVQTGADVREAREIIGTKAMIMSKIETQAAVNNLAEIVAESDAIMIARGDLGVELPPEDVPPLQRQMIAMCRAAGKPVVVATQMLESMITNPVPTRAEASDVATAAYEQVDCVMLSAESASGAHPVAAVEVMARIVEKAEQSDVYGSADDAMLAFMDAEDALSVKDATCEAAAMMAASLPIAALVAFTETGGTALRLSRYRPLLPVVCLTPHALVARQMTLTWGVTSIVSPAVNNTEEMTEAAKAAVQTLGMASTGEHIVIAAGVPFKQAGSTNLLRVAVV
ncbi:MAG: pyruvate kinase [Alphaproteobacteria bacterium]